MLLAAVLLLAAFLLLALSRASWRPGNSLVREQELLGQRGQVLLPCSTSLRGLVRLRVRGSLIDVPAYGVEPDTLQRGDAVVVLHQEGVDLWVAAATEPSP